MLQSKTLSAVISFYQKYILYAYDYLYWHTLDLLYMKLQSTNNGKWKVIQNNLESSLDATSLIESLPLSTLPKNNSCIIYSCICGRWIDHVTIITFASYKQLWYRRKSDHDRLYWEWFKRDIYIDIMITII